ncbi:TetR family transcriptional regulator [Streptomyces sp. NPDC006654]|uniref:acyl-CoA-like ligand-binding transcription factor n=1 Tax=unclassified Streptomyces TaxID=2593676 RepID=UPI0007441726|nr:TetR family transcriptional regulator [Streptomyces antibioticus]KUN29421.1 TetR family transcriptional regulator [Streptomyces antibioticus]
MAERKRLLVRSELAEAAVKLLADQGFEETTVDQIVAAVGMSRRTFSRYFDSKEDVIVHMLAEAGVRLCAELNARPADEPPAVALRRALSVFTSMSVGNPAKMLRVSRLILDTPALLARFLERQSQWQAEMTGILALRAGLDPDVDLRPAVAAGVALTAFQAALRRWVDSDGSESLDEVVDQALALVGPVIELGVDAG